MKTCPICHSPIEITDESQIADLKERGIYVWIADPLLTEKGLAGGDYKGLTKVNWRHIKEIQDARKQQEEKAEISNKTTFSDINPIIPVTKKHILELRTSTEKILAKSDSDLANYFNYRMEGDTEVYIGTYKYGVKVADKTNWTDLNLTGIKKIKAIHIEELRHPLLIEPQIPWYACLSVTPSSISINTFIQSLPQTFEIKAYIGGVDVTGLASYSVEGNVELIQSAGSISIRVNGDGKLNVSITPPHGFEEHQYFCEPGDWECEEAQWEWYNQCYNKTININTYYYELHSYEGELALVDINSPGLGLSGSDGDFSFNITNITNLIGQWKCNFQTTLVHWWWTFFIHYYPKGEFENLDENGVVLDWIPVSEYPIGGQNPNPGGVSSGNFRKRWAATDRWVPGIGGVKVCDNFDFNFTYYLTIQGNWHYEVKFKYSGETSYWVNSYSHGHHYQVDGDGNGWTSTFHMPWFYGHKHSISNGIVASASDSRVSLHSHTLINPMINRRITNVTDITQNSWFASFSKRID